MEAALYIKIQEQFDRLFAQIDRLSEVKKPVPEPLQSDQIDQVVTALSKAQGEMQPISHNRKNQYMDNPFTDLELVLRSTLPILSAQGLSLVQLLVDLEDGTTWLVTRLYHISAQWIGSRKRILPAKNDLQTINSYTASVKRQCICSLLGIATRADDDDGERDTTNYRVVTEKGTDPNIGYRPSDESPSVITREQLQELEYELSEYPDIAEQILKAHYITSLANMPKSKFLTSINKIRTLKQLRNEMK